MMEGLAQEVALAVQQGLQPLMRDIVKTAGQLNHTATNVQAAMTKGVKAMDRAVDVLEKVMGGRVIRKYVSMYLRM
jgi:hypothetical protein